MSFSCPHYDFAGDGTCTRLIRPCVPGRPGCVLRSNSGFVVPVEERLERESHANGPPPGERPAGGPRRRPRPF